ncbi:MAG: hypothetical protein GY773_06085 [Actinomycetia bacterium]|nr:hypothetical protein [Actinomycetes bacterium]
MRFAVESWDPAYGISADDSSLEPADQPVDATVELPLDQWRPLVPAGLAPETVLFVDGVRRIDTRVWIDDEELTRPAICATVAAGVVRCEPGAATIFGVQVERGVYTAVAGATDIETKHGTYEVRPAVDDQDASLYFSLHRHMTELEQSLSVELSRAELVVFDGPLRGREQATSVGYVKTQHVQYLEPAQHRVVAALADGERTPLFAIGGQFPRWSWYLRLPGPRSHALSGIVRLELPGLGEADDAVERAEVISAALPRYASKPHREARAPQNLYPISGLERELRRRLGDVRLMERALRVTSRHDHQTVAGF